MGSKSSEREKFINGNDIPIKLINESSKPLVKNEYDKIPLEELPPPTKPTLKLACPQILASIAALSINIPVGVVIGFSAILIPQLEKSDSEIPVTKEETGFIASMPVLIVTVGAMMAGVLVEWLGRLTAIKLSAIPYVLGWILMATTENLPLLLLGRFFTGFVIAMGPSTSIVYVTEVAHPDMRGALISAGPALTSLGMLFVYATGPFFHWRTIAWTCIFYCLMPLSAMLLWSPESPQWLLSKGNKDKALRSLKFLHRYHPNENTEVERQMRSLVMEQEKKNSGQTQPQANRFVLFFRGMTKPTGYKAFIILFCMFTFQQLSGIYITLFYAVQFFQEVGSSIDAYFAAVMIAAIRLVVGFLTSGLLRKFGRRPLCIVSCLVMTVLLVVAAYFTEMIHRGEGKGYMWIVVTCLLSYMAVSCTGLLPIPWTMTAELFPLEIRGIAQGFTVGIAHFVMFAVTSVYPLLSSILGGPHGVQFLFAGASFSAAIFVYIFLPETHGKTLKEIEDYFQNHTIYPLSVRQPRNDSNKTESTPVQA